MRAANGEHMNFSPSFIIGGTHRPVQARLSKGRRRSQSACALDSLSLLHRPCPPRKAQTTTATPGARSSDARQQHQNEAPRPRPRPRSIISFLSNTHLSLFLSSHCPHAASVVRLMTDVPSQRASRMSTVATDVQGYQQHERPVTCVLPQYSSSLFIPL